MKIKRKAYISLEVIFLLTIMLITGMYGTTRMFKRGQDTTAQQSDAFDKAMSTVKVNGGGGNLGGGGLPIVPPASNPYADKVASVQKLYDVGEANLTDADIITVNGIDCYVLQADFSRGKAELIAKDIYNVRFAAYDSTTYDYECSTLRDWMNDFYVDKLGSDPHILQTTVTYYTSDIPSLDLSTYTQGTVDDYVFALDAIEAKTYASKFSWSESNKQQINDDGTLSNRASYFWSTAGWRGSNLSSNAWYVSYNGGFYSSNVDILYAGARPAFWITLR